MYIKKHPLYHYCEKYGLFRGSQSETIACDAIVGLMRYVLPRANNSLVIGTPTPACIMSNKSNAKTIIDDNKRVVIEVKESSDNIYMVIGNAVDAEKAKAKKFLWNNEQSTRNIPITLDRVDSESFHRYVAGLASKGGICRVILLTSGSWVGNTTTYNKYGMDLNFRSPSIHLTKLFPNLHIIAMTRAGGSFGFNIAYIEGGKEEIYKMNRDTGGNVQLTLKEVKYG